VVVGGGRVVVLGTAADVVVEARVVVVVVAGADGPQAEASTITGISQVDRRGLINADDPLRLVAPTGEIDPTTPPESHHWRRVIPLVSGDQWNFSRSLATVGRRVYIPFWKCRRALGSVGTFF
jgi:hypothetical protein